MIKKLLSVRRISLLFLTVIIGVNTGCEEKLEKSSSKNADTLTVKQVTRPEPPPLKVVFTKEPVKSVHILSELTDRFGDAGMRQVLAINRLDTRHIVIGDTLCVPDTLPDDFLFFSPYPKHISVLDSIPKILIFSYPVQAFVAYRAWRACKMGTYEYGKKNYSHTCRFVFY